MGVILGSTDGQTMKPDFGHLRDQCGLGLAEVAFEFGAALDEVMRWENGELFPPDSVMRSLAILADFTAKPPMRRENGMALEPSQSPASDKPATARQRQSQLGQFMTPPSVADFMASLFAPQLRGDVRLLDAGAGQGALTLAFVQRMRQLHAEHLIGVTAFEFDDKILPALSTSLTQLGNHAECELVKADFIEEATRRICLGKGGRYSHAILNPPYKKITNSSIHRGLLRKVGLETVNLYSGFVGLALELLECGGELVAIIPRSFCNGPYYKPFRRFILQRAAITHIHLFGARNKAFKEDGVLQENIVIKLLRGGEQSGVTVSTSTDDSFSDYTEKLYDFARIVFPDDEDHFIHVPTGDDQQLLERASFGHSLDDLGLTVSTGPVVDFRLRDELRASPGVGTVPLLYPGHFDSNGLNWPKPDFKKPNAICDNMATRKWLYPNGFYAVVRRFSSKEERRRVVANVIDPTKVPGKRIGIENHLNVFHAKRQPISDDLAHGLATFLNATAVDSFFRRFNGHTQVNATDLRAMRYPSKPALISLGQWAKTRLGLTQEEIDERVLSL